MTDLIGKYRFELIEAAAAKKVSLIFTCVYEAPSDDKFIKEIVRRVEKHRGRLCLSNSGAPRKELIKRIKHHQERILGK